MSGSWDYIATAKTLVDYFTGLTEQGEVRWRDGRAASIAWLSVLSDDHKPSEIELSRLDELIRSGSADSGTGWEELRVAYKSWRQSEHPS